MSRHRDDSISAALSHFHSADVLHVIQRFSAWTAPFTADEVYNALRPAVRASLDASPNTLGALFLAAKRQRIIKDTGKMRQSGKPSARGRKVTVWARA